MRNILFSLFLISLAGCSIPSQDLVKSDFVNNNPGCTVLIAEPGEGDDEHAYFGITFTCKGSDKKLFSEELYRKHDGQWIHIPTPHNGSIPSTGI